MMIITSTRKHLSNSCIKPYGAPLPGARATPACSSRLICYQRYLFQFSGLAQKRGFSQSGAGL